MEFLHANSCPASIVKKKIMGPNPLKLCEELLVKSDLSQGSVVLDLGSGQGISSAMLAREYGLMVYAADLWSDPSDNMRFFESLGLTNRQIVPLKADAQALPFATDFFDAIISLDAFHYFGRDPEFVEDQLVPFVKPGGCIYIAMPGMKQDCHDDLPESLLAIGSPEELDFIHDKDWWSNLFAQCPSIEVERMTEMECAVEAWGDWLACDNEHARGDRVARENGALDLMNILAVVLRRR